MRRSATLVLALLVAGCGGTPSTSVQPETLAMTDASEAGVDGAADDANTMIFEIAGERFELLSGICNTYDDGTFRFALGEGQIGSEGRATATIERFDNGAAYEVIVAFEGVRADSTTVSWYARGDEALHDMSASVFGPSISGSALFTSSDESRSTDDTTTGNFTIRCS